MTKKSIQLHYDPSFSQGFASAEVIKDVDFVDMKYVENVQLNFMSNATYHNLPPVTKYVSPWKEIEYVVLEQQPKELEIQEGLTVTIPWSYFLFDLKKSSFCWFFGPDQIYTETDPMHASWLTKETFNEDDTIDSYFEKNNYRLPNDTYGIFDHFTIDNIWSKIITELTSADKDSYGFTSYSKLYECKPEELLTFASGLSIDKSLKMMAEKQLTIKELHTDNINKALNLIPTLSEMIDRL